MKTFAGWFKDPCVHLLLIGLILLRLALSGDADSDPSEMPAEWESCATCHQPHHSYESCPRLRPRLMADLTSE